MEDLKILSPGERLKEIRKLLKVKQDELAGEKFCKNYISMFENNRRKMNPINATYLSEKINHLANDRGVDLTVTSSYFLKNETDIARDKCEMWIGEIENDPQYLSPRVNLNLYKVIVIATKYNLVNYLGKALFIKGINSMNCHRYNCAITQLLSAMEYFSKLDRTDSITEIYMNIGIAFYKQKLFNQAISILNLGEATCSKANEDCDRIINEIKFYKGLCYFALGDYKKAKEITEKVENKQDFIVNLDTTMNSFV